MLPPLKYCWSLTVILLFIQFNQQQFVVFCIMYERWSNKCLAVLTATMMRARNRRQRRLLRLPYAWWVPCPVESWFDLHYYNPTISQEFLHQQLHVTRNTYNCILNILHPRPVWQQSRFRDPLPPEKILALGLYCLGHGNSYVSIGPSFYVGKVTVTESLLDHWSLLDQAVYPLFHSFSSSLRLCKCWT